MKFLEMVCKSELQNFFILIRYVKFGKLSFYCVGYFLVFFDVVIGMEDLNEEVYIYGICQKSKLLGCRNGKVGGKMWVVISLVVYDIVQLERDKCQIIV